MITVIKQRSLMLVIVMLVLVLLPFTAQATTFTWTGGVNTLWVQTTSPYNWSGGSSTTGRSPGSTHTNNTDQAIINIATNTPVTLTSGTVTLGGTGVGPSGDLNYALYIGSSAGANALTLSGNGILGVKGGIYNAQNINLNSSAVLRNDAATAGTHQVIKGPGTITMAGGSIQSANGGIWDFNQAVSGYGTISAPVTNNSTITANSATALTISGALTNSATGVLNAGTSTALPTGTLTLTGALTNSGAMNVYGTLNNNTGAALSLTPINLAGGTLAGTSGYTNAAAWTGYGTISSALNNSSSITVTSGNALTLSGALTNTGTFNVSGASTVLNNNTTSALSLAPITLAGGTLTSTLTGTSNKGYTNSGTWSGYGSINKLTNTGTVNADTSTLTLIGATTNTGGTLGSTNGGSFISTGTITNGTISGNVAMGTGGGISNTSGIMTLASTISGEYGISVASGVNLNGAHLIGPTSFFHYITLSGSGPINLTGNSEWANNFQLNSNMPLNVNNNTLTLTNFNGSLPSGTFLNVGTGNLNVNGPARIYSGGNVHLGGGNITYTTSSSVDTLQATVIGSGDVRTKLLSVAGNLATASGGTLYISGGAELSLPGGTYNNGSLASSSGATLVLRSTISNSQPFTSYVSPSGGTVNLDGATLTAASGAAINLTAGTVNVTNNSTMSGTIGNSSNLTINSGKNLDASGATFTNNGTVTNNGGTATWGNFTNNGAYNSDPSTQTFNTLTVGTNGYLKASAGDKYIITGNFINNSTQNSVWDTSLAALAFTTGTSSNHTLALAGADMGRTPTGFTNNFAWNSLDLTGQTLNLTDGNSIAGAALYVDQLSGLTFSADGSTVTDITGNGFNIYYDPTIDLALNWKTYNLENGGILAPDRVPEPSTMILLGAGLAGLALVRRRRKQ